MTKAEIKKPGKALAAQMLKSMLLGRKFEEKVQWLFAQGLVHGTTHLGIGEEATSTGSILALDEKDYLLATHRGHSQAIAKGVDINAMMAEILGKSTGVCGGKGGSMHISDFDRGILMANGILGANPPIACGAAFTAKRKYPGRATLCFFGDGSANLGGTHEAMNMAAAWDLPIIFVIVNNEYGMSTHISKASRETDLSKRGIAYGIPGYSIDGNDVVLVHATVSEARERCLEEGPILVVQNTYRITGHSKSDGNLYRTKDEIEMWRGRCPINRFKDYAIERGLLTHEQIGAIERETAGIIEESVAFAKNSPEPSPDQLMAGVYA